MSELQTKLRNRTGRFRVLRKNQSPAADLVPGVPLNSEDDLEE